MADNYIEREAPEPSPEECQRLLERIYHEDNLFAQRTSNLLATHAFLAAALAISLPEAQTIAAERFIVPYVVAIFGLVIALFYVPIGIRTTVAIGFWRTWLRRSERILNKKMDCALDDFYKTGHVDTSVGTIGPQDPRMKPMYKVFPWIFPSARSTNRWLGIWLPGSIALFWAATLIALPPHRWASIIGVGLLFVIILILLILRRVEPAYPALTNEVDDKD